MRPFITRDEGGGIALILDAKGVGYALDPETLPVDCFADADPCRRIGRLTVGAILVGRPAAVHGTGR